jgi:hypothetical protein
LSDLDLVVLRNLFNSFALNSGTFRRPTPKKNLVVTKIAPGSANKAVSLCSQANWGGKPLSPATMQPRTAGKTVRAVARRRGKIITPCKSNCAGHEYSSTLDTIQEEF